MRGRPDAWRVALLLAVGAAAATGVVFAFPPIRQDPAYHQVADRRPMLGVPNTLDVLSNLYALGQFLPMIPIPLALVLFPARWLRARDLVGVLGWYTARRGRRN